MVIENKRGQNITLGTIILIILGIVVLVVLIFGFTSGWSNLWEKLVGSGSGSNVDSVRTECELACSTQREYDYCSDSRTVKFGGGITETGSCFSLSGSSTSKAGIVSCNQIDCEGKTIPGYESNRFCRDIGGAWKTACGSGEKDITGNVKDDSDKAVFELICCKA